MVACLQSELPHLNTSAGNSGPLLIYSSRVNMTAWFLRNKCLILQHPGRYRTPFPVPSRLTPLSVSQRVRGVQWPMIRLHSEVGRPVVLSLQVNQGVSLYLLTPDVSLAPTYWPVFLPDAAEIRCLPPRGRGDGGGGYTHTHVHWR